MDFCAKTLEFEMAYDQHRYLTVLTSDGGKTLYIVVQRCL
jgi:hypothetical protein